MAASSLQDVLPDLIERIETEQDVRIRVAFAASSTLARQIEAGAPGDVFLSADTLWADRLAAKGLIAEDRRREPLGNRLVLVTATPTLSQEWRLPQQLDLALGEKRRLVLGDPAHVPAGRYARAALERLGLWQTVERHAVYADNVRAALALVARGESEYGVVYATDVKLTPSVHVVAQFEVAESAPITYSFSLLRAAQHPAAESVFLALLDERALSHFRDAGFVVR